MPMNPIDLAVRRERSEERREFTDGYIDSMLWCNLSWDGDTEGTGEGTDSPLELLRPLLTWDAVKALVSAAWDFFEAEYEDLLVAVDKYGSPYDDRDWGQAGHDYALTRNGHGAGFWDRGLGAVGDRLSNAAKVYGEQNLVLSLDYSEIEAQ